MITTTNIDLKVPFNEKDQAKSLGARWNAQAKLWYVPIGVDAAPFEKWMSPALNISSVQATSMPIEKNTAQANAGANNPFDADMDDINARLRDAYELNEDAF